MYHNRVPTCANLCLRMVHTNMYMRGEVDFRANFIGISPISGLSLRYIGLDFTAEKIIHLSFAKMAGEPWALSLNAAARG
jgi:hypothetical protein